VRVCVCVCVCVLVSLSQCKQYSVHFATFPLSAEAADEPPKRVLAEMKRLSLSPDAFFVLKHGETRSLN
jgi:hypothetical protein